MILWMQYQRAFAGGIRADAVSAGLVCGAVARAGSLPCCGSGLGDGTRDMSSRAWERTLMSSELRNQQRRLSVRFTR